MSRYAELAVLAVHLIQEGSPVVDAWKLAAKRTFPNQPASRNKGCPKCAFLGLAEDGLIKGVPSGSYTNSRLNKEYALKALALLKLNPSLVNDCQNLWLQVMDGVLKKHNEQMDVVAGLWTNGDLL